MTTSTITKPVEVGVYTTPEGYIVKVQYNQEKTRRYSMVWTDFTSTRLTIEGLVVNAHWVYDKSLLWTLTDDMRMSLTDAKKFALVYKKCAKCGRKLKKAESVEAGIGPVCIKWFTF